MTGANPLPEETVNRLLRRVDWRFLLPDPRPGTSLCLAGGTLAEAVDLISDRCVDARLEGARDCDLAVAIDPSPTQLRAARAALRPGGSCYTEWYSPLAGGSAGVRRRMEAARFEDVTSYWAWPWPRFAPPRQWIPLDAEGASSYVIARRGRVWGLPRIRRGLLHAMWRVGVRLRLAVPVCAVARKPGADSTSGLLGTIESTWNVSQLGPVPDRLSCGLLTAGERTSSKVVGLVFAEPDPRPRLAIKVARTPEFVSGLAREEAVLRSLEDAPPAVARGVPKVLFQREWAGFSVLAEAALLGTPLSAVVRRASLRELALKGTDWLADLAQRRESSPRSEWWDRLVRDTLTDFEDSFGEVIDRGMLRETAGILDGLGDLPLVCEHRDFSPWNVMVGTTGELVALDWEGAEPRGLPHVDLLYFLACLAFHAERSFQLERQRASYRTSLDESTPTGRVRRECLMRYCDRTRLDPDELLPLRQLVWLIHARSEYRCFTADAAGTPGNDVLRRGLFKSLWEEEVHWMARGGGRRAGERGESSAVA